MELSISAEANILIHLLVDPDADLDEFVDVVRGSNDRGFLEMGIEV
jgi:hypothetical protein